MRSSSSRRKRRRWRDESIGKTQTAGRRERSRARSGEGAGDDRRVRRLPMSILRGGVSDREGIAETPWRAGAFGFSEFPADRGASTCRACGGSGGGGGRAGQVLGDARFALRKSGCARG